MTDRAADALRRPERQTEGPIPCPDKHRHETDDDARGRDPRSHSGDDEHSHQTFDEREDEEEITRRAPFAGVLIDHAPVQELRTKQARRGDNDSYRRVARFERLGRGGRFGRRKPMLDGRSH